jgi:hypothetical protein
VLAALRWTVCAHRVGIDAPQGGPRRLPHTLPPLVFMGLALVRQLRAQQEQAPTEGFDIAIKKLFQARRNPFLRHRHLSCSRAPSLRARALPT